MNASFVKSAADALYIAAEMEKRAIRLYERAASLWPDTPIHNMITYLLADEQAHLMLFRQMSASAFDSDESSLLLSAYAAGVLFPGGLTEAARQGIFDSPKALIAYAAEQEKIAIGCYQSFAAACENAASDTFLAIAVEEQKHLDELSTMLGRS